MRCSLTSCIAMKMKRSIRVPYIECNCKKVAGIIAIFTMIVAVIILCGYVWGRDVATWLSMGYLPMSMTSAAAFLLSGVILINRVRMIDDPNDIAHMVIPIASYILILLVSVTALEDVLDINSTNGNVVFFGFDLLSGDKMQGPGLASIVGFLIIGVVNITYSFEHRHHERTMRIVGGMMAAIGVTGIIGYVTDTPILYSDILNMSKPISLYSAILFFLLGVGFSLGARHGKSSLIKTA